MRRDKCDRCFFVWLRVFCGFVCFYVYIYKYLGQLSRLSEGWDLAVKRDHAFPKVYWILQYGRNNPPQNQEAANNGLVISAALLVNRN